MFLLTEDWFFVSHFIKRGIAAKAAGWRVVLVARQSAAAAAVRAAGIEFVPVRFDRRRVNPFAEARFVWRLARLYRRLRPDLVHHVALKPIVLGGIAARLAGVPAVVSAPVGLGFVFSSRRLLARVLRPMVSLGLRLTLRARHGRVIFENPDDLTALAKAGLVRRQHAVLIRGAGVDIEAFAPTPEPAPPVVVVLIARMIREKGVADFAAAARLLKGEAVFWLVGAPDPGNLNTVTEAELRGWETEGILRWLGPQRDIAAVLAKAHIACQPSSYGEGLPKSALEAMAAGRPLIATDIPGCREAVVAGETGLLVPPHDPPALAAALRTLIGDPAMRARMGAAGRQLVEANFSDAIICRETLLVYEALIPNRSAP